MVELVKNRIYRDKAIMEIETNNGRDSDEGLLELSVDNSSDNLLDVGTSAGVVIRPGLSRGRSCEHDNAEKQWQYSCPKI